MDIHSPHSLLRSHSLVWTLTLSLQSPTPNISPWSNDWFCAPVQHCPASTVSVTFQWSCVPHGALTPTYCSTMAYKLVTRTPEHPPSWLRWRPFMTNFVPTIISRAFVLISWPSLSGRKHSKRIRAPRIRRNYLYKHTERKKGFCWYQQSRWI